MGIQSCHCHHVVVPVNPNKCPDAEAAHSLSMRTEPLSSSLLRTASPDAASDIVQRYVRLGQLIVATHIVLRSGIPAVPVLSPGSPIIAIIIGFRLPSSHPRCIEQREKGGRP